MKVQQKFVWSARCGTCTYREDMQTQEGAFYVAIHHVMLAETPIDNKSRMTFTGRHEVRVAQEVVFGTQVVPWESED